MRTFMIVWAGQFASLTGSRLSGFALGVWVFQQSGSATLFALIAMFALLPGILIAPIAGVVADRYDRRLVMLASVVGLLSPQIRSVEDLPDAPMPTAAPGSLPQV